MLISFLAAHFRHRPWMAVNSQPLACSRVSRQTVNHPSVPRVADVRENQMKLAQSSHPIQKERQCQFLFTDTSLFFPPPTCWNFSKMPRPKKKRWGEGIHRESNLILLRKLFWGIALENQTYSGNIFLKQNTTTTWRGKKQSPVIPPLPIKVTRLRIT